jgi:hypothetical protein
MSAALSGTPLSMTTISPAPLSWLLAPLSTAGVSPAALESPPPPDRSTLASLGGLELPAQPTRASKIARVAGDADRRCRIVNFLWERSIPKIFA